MPAPHKLNPSESADGDLFSVTEPASADLEAPGQGLLSWLQEHWESAALGCVVFAILSLLAMVLWPAPDTVLTLREIPLSLHSTTPAAPSSEAEDVESIGAVGEETEALSSQTSRIKPVYPHKSSRHHFGPKKPKHPPITSLNKATLVQLQLLPGLGPKMAQRVIDYRHAHGPFTDPSQIMDVKGIGPKKFEKMRPFIKL
jgi:competence ComEA-like helix-hairpin-helix protein